MKKIAFVAAALLLASAPARADYVIKDGNGVLKSVKAGTLAGSVILPYQTPADASGLPFSLANPLAIQFGSGVLLPSFGTPQHFICDSGCGGGGGGGGLSVPFAGPIGANGTPVGFKDGSGNLQPMLGDVTNGQWVSIKASVSIPVTGTFFQATQPVSAAALPLPSGAATQATLASILTALGSPFQAGGSIANTSFGISGTLPAFASTPTFNLGTLNGAATAANQSSVIGPVTPGTAATNTLLVGGTFNSSPITVTTAQQAPLQIDANGFLKVNVAVGGGTGGTASAFAAAFPANGTAVGMSQGGNMVAMTGTSGNLNVQCANCSGSGASAVDQASMTFGSSVFAPMGGVYQTTATGSPLTSGQQGMAQLTINRALHVNLRNTVGVPIGDATTPIQVSLANTAANATAVKVDGSAVTQPVSGTVTANAGTNLNTSLLALESGGNLASIVTQLGAVTASPTANTVNDRLKTINTTLGTPFQAGASIGNTSFQATQATAGNLNATVIGTGTFAVQASIATATAWGINTLGSTTSGQSGQLALGAVTTAAPSYTTAQSNALSLTTAGDLRTVFSNASIAVTQATASSLNATVVGTGTFAVQATLAAETTKVIGTTRTVGNVGGVFDAATAAAVPANALYVGMAQGGNLTGLTGTSGNLNVQCANCSGSGVSTVDEATMTPGTSLFAGSGGFFQTTATNNALTTGQQGMFQVTAQRALFVNLRTATGIIMGDATTPLQVSLANTGSNGTALAVNATLSAETTKVIGTARILGNGGATMDVAVGGAAAPTNALAAAGVYNSSPITITNTQAAALQLDVNGNLKVVGTGIAIGSTTSGQTGSLVMGAATTAAPSYTTAQSNPLSLDLNGSLRVNCTTGCSTSTAQQAPLNAATATATNAGVIGGQFLTTQPTMTNTQQAAVLFSSRGELLVAPGVSGFAVTIAGNQAVNVAQINGVTPLMGNGVTGTGSPRMTLASDGTAISTAGFMSVKVDQTTPGTTNNVTVLSNTTPVSTMNSAGANSGVTAANAYVFDDVSPTAITENSFGYGRMSANRNAYQTVRDAGGNERGLNIDASNSALVNPGTPANWAIGTSTQNSASIANGTLILGQFNTSPTTITSGNMSPFQLDSGGKLLVTASLAAGSNLAGKFGIDQTTPGTTNGTQDAATSSTGAAVPSKAILAGARSGANIVELIQASASVAINVSSATTTQLVALSGSTKIYVTAADVVAGGTGNVTFVYGTGSSCGTGTTSLTGAYNLTAQAGLAKGSGLGPIWVVPAGNAFCVTTSAAVQMSGSVAYTQF